MRVRVLKSYHQIKQEKQSENAPTDSPVPVTRANTRSREIAKRRKSLGSPPYTLRMETRVSKGRADEAKREGN